MSRFVILKKSELLTFEKYEDIPLDFDHLIEFCPDYPEGPHTHEQHEEMDSWNEKLQRLMEIERARSNTNR